MRPMLRYGALFLVLCTFGCNSDEHGPTETRRDPSPEVTREATAQVAADKAVIAYEEALVTTLAEVETTESFKTAANSAAVLVQDSAARNRFITRIAARSERITAIKLKLEAIALVRRNMDSIRTTEVVPLHIIPVKTYDGSGQSVHPDAIRFDKPWALWRCWMVLTPYANANLENPSLYVSQDCEHWVPAPGVAAPLVGTPLGYGYNSDPELVFDRKRGCLQIVYREVVYDNAIKALESCDGISWSEPYLLFSLPNHEAISPSIAEGPDGELRMLYVDAGAYGCGAKTTKLTMRVVTGGLLFSDSSPSEVINLAQPGFVIWHAKWRYVPEKREWWILYAAYPVTSYGCAENDLFIAKSSDLKNWKTFQLPIANRLETRFNFASLYRATFLYDTKGDQIQIITSALTENSGWQELGVTYNYSGLMRTLALSDGLSKRAARSMRAAFNLDGRRGVELFFKDKWP